LFNSYEFLLVFLPAAIFIYALADRYERLRNPTLILLSLVFYGYWDVRFVPLLIVSILGNWLAAHYFARTRNGAVITLAILANLLALGWFKYFNFFAENVELLLGLPTTNAQLALPLGISFFTFHHIMYLVDLRGGQAPLYPLERYALYICFFPQAISGPLARWSEVVHQFGRRAFAPGWEGRCAVGAVFIVLGLMQKTLLADPLGAAVDPIFAQALAGPVADGNSWITLAFVLQVFFDFSGYTDIAIGVGLIFGIELPRNFDAPFRSLSIIDLWRRWHMTLARFLRDYVFTPLTKVSLGGRRHRVTRMLAAAVLTMALCGLWHGAGWTYVLWGTSQGLALVFAAVWRKYLPVPPLAVGWALTIGFFMASGIVFRAGTLEAAWHVYQGFAVLPVDRLPGRNAFLLALFCAIVLPPSHEIVRRLTERPRLPVAAALAAAAVVILAVLGERESYQFVYFQF
jgi:D-alanyl-lipoteichoic acid acyltransferase DltB (MBOAT superfamily)